MSTSKPDTWFGAKTGYPADLTVCIFIDTFIEESFVVWYACSFRLLPFLRYAFSFETRKTLLLSVESVACMTTRVCFVTICIFQVYALLSETDIIVWVFVFVLFLIRKFSVAESTLFGNSVPYKFFACLSCMVWLGPTVGAEGLAARSTFDPVLSHVNCSFW